MEKLYKYLLLYHCPGLKQTGLFVEDKLKQVGFVTKNENDSCIHIDFCRNQLLFGAAQFCPGALPAAMASSTCVSSSMRT